MMKMKTKSSGLSHITGGSEGSGGSDVGDWEMRPGGMLVQKRDPDLDLKTIPPPSIRVRVKHGSIYHQIHISSQASFGELKKMLSGPTGLHHQDQKLIYKNKERDSKSFLDTEGVKDRSKMVLLEDPISREKRFLEMRKNLKMEKASKTISDISLEVDKLVGQVSALESIITRGGKVVEKDLLRLIEMLMNQLVKLDGIIAIDGDVALQRKMQVKKVQKYVETLDMLKIKNSTITNTSNGKEAPTQDEPQKHAKVQTQSVPIQSPRMHSVRQLPQHQKQPLRHSTSSVVVTTKWETFDTSAAPTPPVSLPTANQTHHPNKFNWELFE